MTGILVYVQLDLVFIGPISLYRDRAAPCSSRHLKLQFSHFVAGLQHSNRPSYCSIGISLTTSRSPGSISDSSSRSRRVARFAFKYRPKAVVGGIDDWFGTMQGALSHSVSLVFVTIAVAYIIDRLRKRQKHALLPPGPPGSPHAR